MLNNIKYFIYEFTHRPFRLLNSLVDEPAIALIYHRVNDLKNDNQLLAVKPENFYNQIKYLKNNYNLLTVDEFTDIKLSGNKFPPKSIIITFDDGYQDNFKEALQILTTLKVQALFFITTSLLNTNEVFWWDKLDYLFFSEQDFPSFLTLLDNSTLITSSTKNKINAYNKLHKILKHSKVKVREELLEHISKKITNDYNSNKINKFMSSDEIMKMSESQNAVIGAHTHTHTPLSILSYEEQVNDITESVKILETITNKKIEHFSYPFGTKKDYNKITYQICNELNFKIAFANYHSQIHKWTNNYNLPRILIRDWDFEQFKQVIKKAFRY